MDSSTSATVVGALITFIAVAYSSVRTSSKSQLGQLGLTVSMMERVMHWNREEKDMLVGGDKEERPDKERKAGNKGATASLGGRAPGPDTKTGHQDRFPFPPYFFETGPGNSRRNIRLCWVYRRYWTRERRINRTQSGEAVGG